MTNNERIEAYFNNELTGSEGQQLMQDINSDASLKSEYQFQQGVIDGIKDYRKKELIARLDNIQIASTGQSVLLKTIGVVGIATVVTVGSYLWVNRADDQPINPAEVIKTEEVVTQSEEPQQIATATEEAEKESIVEEEKPATKIVADKVDTTPVASTPKEESPTVIPDVVIPEVDEPETGTSTDVDEDLSAPEAMAASSIRLRSSTDVEVKLNKKYDFHYQVKDGGLILYGNFNNSPFEVIELKTNQGINSYLYFEDHFYSLTNDSEDIKPLMVIDNKELIKELEKRR
ncbi:MAG: hypothetical protein DRI71_07320 [Bacteroidetes bacterium]|nr:MAG: hypothetical protein DRI71_07320 [Bacteroidota bacterium]